MTISTEDRLQIEDLAARYNQAIDLSDPDGWVSCFSADGELVIGRVGSFSAGVLGLAEGRWRGPAELHDFATATASRQFRHWSCNRVLASTAAGITSVSYMNVYYLGLPPATGCSPASCGTSWCGTAPAGGSPAAGSSSTAEPSGDSPRRSGSSVLQGAGIEDLGPGRLTSAASLRAEVVGGRERTSGSAGTAASSLRTTRRANALVAVVA